MKAIGDCVLAALLLSAQDSTRISEVQAVLAGSPNPPLNPGMKHDLHESKQ